MVSNLKTKLATAVLLAMTLIALSIPVMATVCQYGGDVASECTVGDDAGDICAPDTVTAIDEAEAPVCDDVDDDCAAVDEAAADDTCGAVTISAAETECAQDVDNCENVDVTEDSDSVCDAEDDACDTIAEEDDACADEETADDACPTNTICNGSKTCPTNTICNGSKTCPKATATCVATTTHKPPCVPSMAD